MSDNVKRLYRTTEDRVIAGVAGGLGEFLDIDPTIIRLIFAFSAFLGGTGILVYVVMWLVVPREPAVAVKTAPKKKAAPKKVAARKTAAKKS